ncbi:hypothetical protein DAKH74_001720 [Maudiozyma humilis]|uniref:DOD-type homing endonuclease domain-containing protein n=1 Tax=Maudiozyma humilis TaxID=51915 RepID=A0AAV5RQY5_MAUHU|nr:hypothetical protein DAKH74_001720 [Kazachstania humilis]
MTTHTGLAPSTRVYTADASLIPVGDVKVGDMLLCRGGIPKKVGSVTRANVLCCRRTLRSMHKRTEYTGITMPSIVCGIDTVFAFGTSQVVKNYIKQKVNYKPTPKRMVVITVMRDYVRTDGSTVSLPYNMSKQFDLEATEEEVSAYIERTTVPDIKWHVWKGTQKDHAMVKGDAKISTRRMTTKVRIHRPFFRQWLEDRFAGYGFGSIDDDKVKAMAWMTGFWLGDGFRKGPYFALHSEDHDVNNHLKRAAKLWRMEYVFQKLPGSPYQAMCRLDYYPLGEIKKTMRKDTILIRVLCELGFYSNGEMNGPKGGPLFMATDELDVIIHCLCGLIDSDGTTAIYDNVRRIKLVTIYPPIRDLIIALGQNLGVSVTSTFEPAHITSQGAQSHDTWIIHMFAGQSEAMFEMILANLACDRKRDPPVRMSRRYRVQIGLILDDDDFDDPIEIRPRRVRRRRIVLPHLRQYLGQNLKIEINMLYGIIRVVDHARWYYHGRKHARWYYHGRKHSRWYYHGRKLARWYYKGRKHSRWYYKGRKHSRWYYNGCKAYRVCSLAPSVLME